MTKPVVFVNGVFDILHVGHYNLLASACYWKNYHNADIHVAIDSDNKVRRDKGKNRPIYSQQERLKTLQLLSYEKDCPIVDQVHIFDSNEELNDLIKSLQPLIMIKGEEWKGNAIGEEHCEQVIFYPKFPFSSTQIIEKIKQKHLKEINERFPGASIW